MGPVTANVRDWETRQEDQLRLARQRWASEPMWGNFSVPEAEAGVLPADVHAARTVELGCRTGYVSAWVVEYHLSDGDWVRLPCATGFQIELRAPESAADGEQLTA